MYFGVSLISTVFEKHVLKYLREPAMNQTPEIKQNDRKQK